MARLLIVEDNEVNRDMLRKRLERRGFEIITAESGEQGLELARAERPDAVIMDLGLPGIDGWETTRRLKADPSTAAMPVIAVSAHVSADARDKAVAAGCADFEPKPVQLDALVNKINAALAKRVAAVASTPTPLEIPPPPPHLPEPLSSAPTKALAPPPPRVVPPPPSLTTPPSALGHARPAARLLHRPPIRPPALKGSLSDTMMIPGSAHPPPAHETLPAEPLDKPGPKRILVVEDNDPNRVMLCRRLQKQGYETAEARDGREAIDQARAQRFDLMLCDIMMPEVDGFQVLETLKADPDLQALPIIMISALDEMASVVRCIEMGAEDYLQKPYDPVLLQARINACLDKRRLRDQELEYLRAVTDLTQAAAMVEKGEYDPAMLAAVARRDDALGRLARVFEKMAKEVQAKVNQLTREVLRLKVEIDEARKTEQVAEITESSYFQQLQQKASQLRRRFRKDGSAPDSGPLPAVLPPTAKTPVLNPQPAARVPNPDPIADTLPRMPPPPSNS